MCKTFSPQYVQYIRSPEWRVKSSSFKAATGNRCALLPWLKANHTHHLHYQNLTSEEFIRDCVPLHSKCHSFVHWIYDRKIPWLRKLLDFYLRAIAYLLSVYTRLKNVRTEKRMPRSRKPKPATVVTRLTRKPTPDERRLVKGLPRVLPLSRNVKPTISELEPVKRNPKKA